MKKQDFKGDSSLSPIEQLPDFSTLYADLKQWGIDAYLKALGDPELPELQILRRTLEMSRRVLGKEPQQLAGHLIGRLGGNSNPAVVRLLDEARAGSDQPWLCPLFPSLEPVDGPLRHVLQGHRDFVGSIVFLPDSRRFVSASEDGTMRVWHAEDGVQLHILREHNGPINVLTLAPQGDKLYSGGDDRTIRVWDVNNWTVTQVWKRHKGFVRDLSLTANGKKLLSCSEDGTVKVLSAVTGKTRRVLRGHDVWVNAVVVTPGGELAISSALNNDLKSWDLRNFVELAPFFQSEGREFTRVLFQGIFIGAKNEGSVGHENYAVKLALSPDGSKLYSIEHELIEWDVATRAQLRRMPAHTDSMQSLAISPDGRYAATGAEDIKVWDLTLDQPIATLTGHTEAVYSVAFSPDMRWLVSGSKDTTIRVWDLQQVLQSRPSALNVSVRDWAVSDDGQLALSGSNDGQARLWDLATGQLLFTLTGHVGRFVEARGFREGGKLALTSSHNGELILWDTQTGLPTLYLRHPTDKDYWIDSVDWTPDGHYALVGSVSRSTVKWELRSGAEPEVLERSADFGHVALSPDGKYAAAGSYGESKDPASPLQVWDFASGKLLWEFLPPPVSGEHIYFNQVKFTPAGDMLVAATSLGSLYLFDPARGEVLSQWAAHHKAYITKMHFCPDGTLWTAATCKGELLEMRRWDLGMGAALRKLTGRRKEKIYSPCFSKDGRYAVYSAKGTLVLWDLERDVELASFHGDSDEIYEGVISSDNRLILAAESRRKVHVLKVMK